MSGLSQTPPLKRPCTDDDMKQLRDFIEGRLEPRSEEAWNIRLHKTEFYGALIARTEAAEDLADAYRQNFMGKGGYEAIASGEAAWRKAAGK